MPDVIRIDSKAAKKRVEDAELVPIFELDGTTYSIAKLERSDLSLEYLGRIEEEGIDAAQAWMIRTTVGEAGFEALRGVEGLSPEDWRGVMENIQAVINPKARMRRA